MQEEQDTSGTENEGTLDPHSIEGARAAGGYNNGPGAHAPQPASPAPGSVQADVGAAEAAEGDNVDDGRITSQKGREAAGAFTGTGNQDALRTSGRLGGTDAHHADERTVEDGADERAQDGGDRTADEGDEPVADDVENEGQAADADDTDGQPAAA